MYPFFSACIFCIHLTLLGVVFRQTPLVQDHVTYTHSKLAVYITVMYSCIDIGSTDSIFMCLWSEINKAVIPDDENKSFLLLEMPGYPINSDLFNPEKFNDNPAVMSPAHATALLVDRVPAFARYFHDTGSQISFFWKQLLETYAIVKNPVDESIAKAKYDDAIEMLYGGQSGYCSMQKSEMYKNLDSLCDKWQKELNNLESYKKRCLRQGENFESNAGPYVERVDNAFVEYNNLKSQIKKYQAAIFEYTRGDLSTVLLQQRQGVYSNAWSLK